jgi:hypothetical protein
LRPASPAISEGNGRMTARKLSILLSEGTSTSAREAVTALGVRGHHIEVVDPQAFCLARFSGFVRRVHRCPPLGSDPEGYRDFVLGLLAAQRFDVLVPMHEQGYLLAKIQDQIAPHTAVALPDFEAYELAVSKFGFTRLLSELGIPQPATRIAKTREALRAALGLPVVLKTEIGTASRGVWFIADPLDLDRALEEIDRAEAFGDGIVVQEMVDGPVEHAQAVFSTGRMVAMHGFRQLVRGAGGGDAAKESVARPEVREHLARIGARLRWHGSLSVDYILRQPDGVPAYIDCNPRLVEPMSGVLAGIDLMDILVRVSTGEKVPEQPPGRTGVHSHLAMQLLLGLALRGATRREILRECWHLWMGRGRSAGSREELTPVGLDGASLVPLLLTAVVLLASPGYAHRLAAKGWGAQLLTRRSMLRIGAWDNRASGSPSSEHAGCR